MIEILSQTFRFDFATNTALSDEWDLMLDGLTNDQVDMCLWTMRETDHGDFMPTTGKFKSWARQASKAHLTLPVHQFTDDTGAHFMASELVDGTPNSPDAGRKVLRPIMESQPYEAEVLDGAEYDLRMRTLSGIMSGELHREIDWRNLRNLREDNVLQRNWLREKLGWSPL